MAEYDADVVSALKGVELTEEQATSLAKKLKTHNIKLALIPGLMNENVITITTVMIEQATSRDVGFKFVALIAKFALHSRFLALR